MLMMMSSLSPPEGPERSGLISTPRSPAPDLLEVIVQLDAKQFVRKITRPCVGRIIRRRIVGKKMKSPGLLSATSWCRSYMGIGNLNGDA